MCFFVGLFWCFFHVPYVFSWFSWCPFNAFPPLNSPGRQQTWPTGKQSKIWQVFPIYFICPKLGSYWDHCGDKFGSWKLILRSTGNWSFCTMITRTTCARLAASGGVKTLLCVSLKSYEAGAYAGGNRKVSVFHGYSGVSLGFHRCPSSSAEQRSCSGDQGLHDQSEHLSYIDAAIDKHIKT